jgi:hypothetical protein
VFVNGTDPCEWAGVAGRLLDERASSPEAWSARCESARARAGHFSWQTYTAQMARLYATLTESASTTGTRGRMHLE